MRNVNKKTLTLHIKAVLKSWDLNSQNSQPEWPLARSVLGSYSLYLFPGSLFNLYPTFHSETLNVVLYSPPSPTTAYRSERDSLGLHITQCV